MPIKVPNNLPARKTLEAEGVVVMTDAARSARTSGRCGSACSTSCRTRSHRDAVARLIGATPLQVELTLRADDRPRRSNTPGDHMIAFYETWEEVRDEKFDGFIITGAPVEHCRSRR